MLLLNASIAIFQINAFFFQRSGSRNQWIRTMTLFCVDKITPNARDLAVLPASRDRVQWCCESPPGQGLLCGHAVAIRRLSGRDAPEQHRNNWMKSFVLCRRVGEGDQAP